MIQGTGTALSNFVAPRLGGTLPILHFSRRMRFTTTLDMIISRCRCQMLLLMDSFLVNGGFALGASLFPLNVSDKCHYKYLRNLKSDLIKGRFSWIM